MPGTVPVPCPRSNSPKMALRISRGTPGPSSSTARMAPPAPRTTCTQIRPARGLYFAALSMRFSRMRWIKTGSTRATTRSTSPKVTDRPRTALHSLTTPVTSEAMSVDTTASGSKARPLIFSTSSSCSMRRVIWVPERTMASTRAVACSSLSSCRRCCKMAAEPTTADSGLRTSCETARRNVSFSESSSSSRCAVSRSRSATSRSWSRRRFVATSSSTTTTNSPMRMAVFQYGYREFRASGKTRSPHSPASAATPPSAYPACRPPSHAAIPTGTR